jgi:Mn-dependent DtxR family transcriptional regulator
MDDKTKLREKIISLLETKGSLYLGDIAKEISVSPQSGYKFIEELMEEGIVTRKQGSLKISLA